MQDPKKKGFIIDVQSRGLDKFNKELTDGVKNYKALKDTIDEIPIQAKKGIPIISEFNNLMQDGTNFFKGLAPQIKDNIDGFGKLLRSRRRPVCVLRSKKNDCSSNKTRTKCPRQQGKKRKDEEQKTYDGMLSEKQEIERKERELRAKKAKKEAEQEKIDKLNRKVALMKNIADSTASVAQGVTKTLGAYPFPFNIALAAIVGAAGAVQIGIMTKQLAKFADGGLLRGKRHAQGGMRIEGTNMEVEGGEYVVNRESTSKNLRLVRYINSERRELKPADLDSFFARSSRGFEPAFSRMMQNGGQLPIAEPTANIDNETLVQAIQSIRIEPRVAVSDIYRVQDSMVSVDGWAGV
ncbi:hypothetical protein [Dysgonomonas reticulitermitis]